VRRGGREGGEAGLDDAPHTGAGAPMMAAGFQRGIERRAAGAHAGGAQRVNLGMRTARALMKPLSYDHAVVGHHDGADQRVRAGAAAATRGVEQRTLHERAIRPTVYHFSSNRPSTYSSAENGTRSSMLSPTPT